MSGDSEGQNIGWDGEYEWHEFEKRYLDKPTIEEGRDSKVPEMVARYQTAKNTKVGQHFSCPTCETQVLKNSYQRTFCKKGGKKRHPCKDKYHNTVDNSRWFRHKVMNGLPVDSTPELEQREENLYGPTNE